MTTDDPQDVIDPASMIYAGSSSEQDPAEVPADTVMQIGGIWGSLVSKGGRFLKKMSLRPGSERDGIGKDDEGSTAMAGESAHNMSAESVFDSDEESEMGTHARSVDPVSDAERERQAIIIFQISKAGDTFLRVDLNRLDLLAECRRDVERGLRHTHKGHSAAEVLREVGEGLQPRDMRRLVEGQDHVILARAGATVLALGYLSAVVTHAHAYVVTPEGADELLQPLLLRLHRHAGAAEPEIPFEFRVRPFSLPESFGCDVRRMSFGRSAGLICVGDPGFRGGASHARHAACGSSCTLRAGEGAHRCWNA
jgi:hypothetical protein